MLLSCSRHQHSLWRRLSSTVVQNPYPFPHHLRPTPYQIFHLPKNASQEEIKARYNELIRIYHPDKARMDSSITPEVAHARFLSIREAYKSIQKPGKFEEVDVVETPSAAAYRAMNIYRRKRLYEGSDERWKDRVIVAAGVVAIFMIFVQLSYTRYQAMLEIRRQQKQNTKKRQETVEDDRLAD